MMTQMIVLAQGPQVPWEETSHWLYGLLGFLGVVALGLMIAVNSRKLFMKHPPIHEELATIREEFTSADSVLRRSIEQERADRETQILEFQRDRQRSVEKIHRKMNGISRNVYLIAGKLGITPTPNHDESED